MNQTMIKVGVAVMVGIFAGDYLATEYGKDDAGAVDESKAKAFRYGGGAVAGVLVHKFL